MFTFANTKTNTDPYEIYTFFPDMHTSSLQVKLSQKRTTKHWLEQLFKETPLLLIMLVTKAHLYKPDKKKILNQVVLRFLSISVVSFLSFYDPLGLDKIEVLKIIKLWWLDYT